MRLRKGFQTCFELHVTPLCESKDAGRGAKSPEFSRKCFIQLVHLSFIANSRRPKSLNAPDKPFFPSSPSSFFASYCDCKSVTLEQHTRSIFMANKSPWRTCLGNFNSPTSCRASTAPFPPRFYDQASQLSISPGYYSKRLYSAM